MTEAGQQAHPAVGEALERAHRSDWGRLLALLTRHLRSLDVAEEALQDAFTLAITAWQHGGVPDNPAGWLLTAARRRALDRLRRDRVLHSKLPLLIDPDPQPGPEEGDEMSTIPDLRLRLLFTCCHPALALDSRVALTLRCVGGLSTAEIARAFLVSEPTMAARITRAKKKIAAAGIPYREPSDAELPDRLGGVLAVLYLVFNEGYTASTGDVAIRRDLCEEAIRLARVLVTLAPDEPEALGLLALMLLQHARRDARFDSQGRLVLLPDQDRSRWDTAAVAEGAALLGRASRHARLGVYQLQAAIAAQHSTTGRAQDTDWQTVATLYEGLEGLTASPIVALNRAVAVAEYAGPAVGLSIVDGLTDELQGYHLLHSTRADLLRRVGRAAEATAAYRQALELARSPADRELLARRLAEVGG
ncbi:MAG: RNA polymerase subunit sigma-24 [Actinomycetota bacterium]|nr:RNA polymerase subunit sigma-24 [Actinomycetota bacterium]